MSEPVPGERALAAQPCQSVCTWTRTNERRLVDAGAAPAAVFACVGCGSEWVRSELWTPVDADGHVPAAVRAERELPPTTTGG
jgi:hypothetical protein